jgi:hypothetical protein
MAVLGSFVARGAFTITPSNTALAVKAYGLYIGGDGDLVVTGEDGVVATFVGVSAGQIIPIVCTHVRAASTVTNVLGFKAF